MNRYYIAPIAAFILIACGAINNSFDYKDKHRCNQSALSSYNFNGSSLRNKQLSLTFDDGPGSRTQELSDYLQDQNIKATFFINGHCFDNGNACGNYKDPSDILPKIASRGHLIANHTQDHFNLTDTNRFPIDGGSSLIYAEISNTDDIIAQYSNNIFLFRPPYGAWDNRAYQTFQNSSMNKYVGPINWDIGGAMSNGYGADWDCWQNTNDAGVKSTSECANLYLNEIHSVNRGIVLMHDADYNKSNSGNTIDMVKYLVPILKSEGYSFVCLNEVPSIADALGIPVPPIVDEPDAAPPIIHDAGAISDASAFPFNPREHKKEPDDHRHLYPPMDQEQDCY